MLFSVALMYRGQYCIRRHVCKHVLSRCTTRKKIAYVTATGGNKNGHFLVWRPGPVELRKRWPIFWPLGPSGLRRPTLMNTELPGAQPTVHSVLQPMTGLILGAGLKFNMAPSNFSPAPRIRPAIGCTCICISQREWYSTVLSRYVESRFAFTRELHP